jgi:RNA polymerase sigma-70 factor, ECF subfamily
MWRGRIVPKTDQAREDALLERAKAGDVRAFEDVIAPHLPMLLAYSRAICNDHHTAEDVVQETALIASRNLHNLFEEADFAGWLKAIARRQALAMRRKSARLQPVIESAIEKAYENPAPTATHPERAALTECLELLSDRAGQIVRAHYFDGAAISEMATSFKLNPNTLKTILLRARQALENCVQRQMRSEEGSSAEPVV